MNGDTATITIFAVAAVPVLGLMAYGVYHLVLGLMAYWQDGQVLEKPQPMTVLLRFFLIAASTPSTTPPSFPAFSQKQVPPNEVQAPRPPLQSYSQGPPGRRTPHQHRYP